MSTTRGGGCSPRTSILVASASVMLTVLVHGGLGSAVAADLDTTLKAVIGPAMERLSMRFAGPAASVSGGPGAP